MQAKDSKQQALMERLMKDMGDENRDWTLNVIRVADKIGEEGTYTSEEVLDALFELKKQGLVDLTAYGSFYRVDTREWEEVGRNIYYGEQPRLLKRKVPI